MSHGVRRAWSVVGAIFVLVSTSQRASGTGVVVGTVIDEAARAPVAYANVIVAGTPYGAMSLADGSFRIPGLEPGAYKIMASTMGAAGASDNDMEIQQVINLSGGCPEEAVLTPCIVLTRISGGTIFSNEASDSARIP